MCNQFFESELCVSLNPGKMVLGKIVPEKWSPGEMVPGKMVPEINGSRKIGPRETQKQKIVRWASSIVMCVESWNIRMWSIYENPKLDNKHKTRKQARKSETKNRGMSVEHRGLCVCVCVCVCVCDQFMKSQNSTTNFSGLL